MLKCCIRGRRTHLVLIVLVCDDGACDTRIGGEEHVAARRGAAKTEREGVRCGTARRSCCVARIRWNHRQSRCAACARARTPRPQNRMWYPSRMAQARELCASGCARVSCAMSNSFASGPREDCVLPRTVPRTPAAMAAGCRQSPWPDVAAQRASRHDRPQSTRHWQATSAAFASTTSCTRLRHDLRAVVASSPLSRCRGSWYPGCCGGAPLQLQRWRPRCWSSACTRMRPPRRRL